MGLFLIIALSCTWAKASPTSHLFVNPYYPEFNDTSEDLTQHLMDLDLQRDIQQYIQRRERLESLMIEHTTDYAGMLQKNTFVTRRMMDRASRKMLKSPWIKKSSIGRLSDGLKKNLETDLQFKDEKNIEHKFDFKIAAFQGQAFIQYSGFTKAQLRYDIRNGGSLAMIFQHHISPLSTIGIESTLAGEYRTQALLLNINW